MMHHPTGIGSASGPIRIGIVGLGAAGRAFIPAILAHPGFRLAAVADPVAQATESVAAELGVTGYHTMQAMLAHPGLDAVYIATPTDLHPEHVALACAAKKHVLVEKPMVAQVEQAYAMIAAAEQAGVQLVVGHSHSYDLPLQRMREIIAGGTLGRVRMVNTWCFTDWIYRPRRPEELDASMGGGVTYRQGSHQFDIIRLLCGGMVKSVRARTFDWDPTRRAIGAHIAYLDFPDGAAATAVYNGYGNFLSMDLCFNVGEWGFIDPPESRIGQRTPSRQTLPASHSSASRWSAASGVTYGNRREVYTSIPRRGRRRSSCRRTALPAIWSWRNSTMPLPAARLRCTMAGGGSPISKSAPQRSHRPIAGRTYS